MTDHHAPHLARPSASRSTRTARRFAAGPAARARSSARARPSSGKVYVPSSGYDNMSSACRDDRGRRRRGRPTGARSARSPSSRPSSTTARRRPSPTSGPRSSSTAPTPPIIGVDVRDIPIEEFRVGPARAGRVEAARRARRRATSATASAAPGRASSSAGSPPASPTPTPDRSRSSRFEHDAPATSAIVATSQTPSYRLLQRHRADADHAAASTTCSSADRARPRRASSSPSPAAATTCRACRSPSCRTSTASARGRPSTRATSRWTARGRCSRRWLRLQLGDIDVALVIGSGKSSPGRPREVFPLQTDPYVMAPLGLDPVSLAGIQARALLDAGQGHRAGLRRGGVPQPARRPRQPQRAGRRGRVGRRAAGASRTTRRRCASTTCRPSPTAPPRWCSPRGDRARELTDTPGVDPRHRPPHRVAPPGPARPHRPRRRPRMAAAKAGVARRPDRRRRAHGQLQPRGDRAARGARPRRSTPESTRRAGRWPATR